jgi:hypothetical protein
MQGGNTPQYCAESLEAAGEQEEWIQKKSQAFHEPNRTGEFDYTVISGSRGRKEEKRYEVDSGGRLSNTGGGRRSYWRDETRRRSR